MHHEQKNPENFSSGQLKLSGTLELARHRTTGMIKSMKLLPHEQLDEIYPAMGVGGGIYMYK